MANLLASLFGTGKPKPGIPMDAATAKTTPDATYLENMQKLLKGDVSSALTGGEKLMALGALLRSAARGSQVTPQEVMGQVRQTAQTRAATQLQLAQLQAKAQQDAALRASQDALVAALPKTFRDQAAAMDPEKRGAFLSTLRMNPSYKNVTENGKTVTKVTYQQSGLVEDAPFQLPPDLEKGFLNGKAVWFNKDTGLPHIDPTTGQPVPAGDPMTPKEAADVAARTESLAIRRMNANRPRGGGGGGGGAGPTTEPKMVTIDGRQVMAQWDKNAGRYVPFTRQNVSRPQGGISIDPRTGKFVISPQ